MIHVRRARITDAYQISEIYKATANGGAFSTEQEIESQICQFPYGQFVAVDLMSSLGYNPDTMILGHCSSLLIESPVMLAYNSWNSITGTSAFYNHSFKGKHAFLAELAVHPDNQGQGVAKALLDARQTALESLPRIKSIHVGMLVASYNGTKDQFQFRHYVQNHPDKLIEHKRSMGFKISDYNFNFQHSEDPRMAYAVMMEKSIR